MSDGEDFEDAFFAHFRPRMREEKARAQHRKDERKHRTGQSRELRRLIKERGIIAVLRQCGVEDLNANAQFTLASQVYRWKPFPPFKYEQPRVDDRSKRSKLRRLADDQSATPGERQAALAAIERLNARAVS